jgi:hypothetical protein
MKDSHSYLESGIMRAFLFFVAIMLSTGLALAQNIENKSNSSSVNSSGAAPASVVAKGLSLAKTNVAAPSGPDGSLSGDKKGTRTKN